MTVSSTTELIKQAVSEYFTAKQWLLLMLKNTWVSDEFTGTRDVLQLSEYATLDITRYMQTTRVVYVYVGVSVNPLKRPKWLSCIIANDMDYPTIRKEVHNLLNLAQEEVMLLNRGRSGTVTLMGKECVDVTNQLSST